MRIPDVLETGATSVAFYVAASRSPATLRAYASDIAAFRAAGGQIPATEECVAGYLASSSSLAFSTLRRRIAAISDAHKAANNPDPTSSVLVKRVLRGIARSRGQNCRSAHPFLIDHLRLVVGGISPDLEGLRDRAILCLGFFCALRRSELARLRYEDLGQSETGNFIRLRRSKTDQAGRTTDIPLVDFGGPVCPVGALAAWCNAAGLDEGLLFRNLAGGRLRGPISGQMVGTILKRRAKAAGLPEAGLSAHSLRSGFIVSAVRAGISVAQIRTITRHRSLQSLEPYLRHAGPPSAAEVVKLAQADFDRSLLGDVLHNPIKEVSWINTQSVRDPNKLHDIHTPLPTLIR